MSLGYIAVNKIMDFRNPNELEGPSLVKKAIAEVGLLCLVPYSVVEFSIGCVGLLFATLAGKCFEGDFWYEEISTIADASLTALLMSCWASIANFNQNHLSEARCLRQLGLL